MLKRYGIIGIALIVLVEINFFLKIEPFASWYFPIVWFSYILVIDALVYQIRKRSLLSNKPLGLAGLFILSAFFWYIFEFLNLSIQNWSYIGTQGVTNAKTIYKFLSFSTILPALFETTELIRSVRLFDKIKLKKKFNVTKTLIYSIILTGIACFFLPLIIPDFAFPLIWLSFFLILDPINFLNKQPSILGHLKNKKLSVPLSLLLAGITLGFLWEFWNYWAVPKWIYNIPLVGFFKIFEMPVLGYLGYFPFSFELYSMYWFVKGLFAPVEKLLI